MRKALYLILLIVVLCAGCSEQEDGGNPVQITSSSIVELYAVEQQSATVDFQTSASWTASCPAGWLSFSPTKGEAGPHTIKITSRSTNRTKAKRTTQLTISSGSEQRKVTVVQSDIYAIFDQKEYVVGAEGATLKLGFTSNLDDSDNLRIAYVQTDWLSWENSAQTRGEWKGNTYEIVVKPNESKESRTAVFALGYTVDKTRLMLDTTYLTQKGLTGDYESIDYSADGKVAVLQKAILGKGIPIVIMGDGFTDKDIKDSTYARVMEKTLENLFTEEPVRSLRDYFDVYAVTAVSKNGNVGSGYSTVFSTEPSRSSSFIEFSDDKVAEYVSKVDRIDIHNTLAVVILNANSHNGVTALYTNRQTGLPDQYSVSLCTLNDGIDSEAFRQALVHEAIGHGLSKLSDEYGYTKNGALPDDEIRQIAAYHKYNWMLNVDTESDKSRVIWSPFIGNDHFASEHISVYEGGYTYISGIYRPTYDSMMNQNASPFNAPSRKAIYDKVMQLGEGRDASTLEEFTAFDELHKPTRWNYPTTRSATGRRLLAPPVLKSR